MPVTKITANGTYQIKQAPGYVTALSVPNAGTSWTLQLFDGPGLFNTSTYLTIYGGAAGGTLTTGTTVIAPLYFGNGIQAILAGTAGELDIQWY
jgi:hypothetical protein